jgi:hypothetical protein
MAVTVEIVDQLVTRLLDRERDHAIAHADAKRWENRARIAEHDLSVAVAERAEMISEINRLKETLRGEREKVEELNAAGVALLKAARSRFSSGPMKAAIEAAEKAFDEIPF